MPPRADPFKPTPGVHFSKRAVNRAGELMRQFWYENKNDDEHIFDGWNQNELIDAMTTIAWWRGEHAEPLKKVASGLRYHSAKEGALVRGKLEVTQRLKRRNTMINKLDRESSMKLSQMHDIGGVRALMPSLDHLYAVSRRLKKNWSVKRTRDYIDSPKISGYRAIHHIVKRGNRFVEVQLRTVRQDAWANQVEEDGRATGTGFKFGFGPDQVHEYYQDMAAAFAYMDRDEPLPAELIASLNYRYPVVAPELRRRRPPNTGKD
jgi:putative GTP pyrophosphokinase